MKDVLDLDLQLFLRNLLPEEHAVLQEMRVFAEEHHIPVVDPEVGNLLHILTGLVQPENILEIGTAIGCSTIAMAQAMARVASWSTWTTLLSIRVSMALSVLCSAVCVRSFLI